MHQTWYVLEDGSPGNPDEVAPDDAGVLRHASGMAVAIGPHGPRTRGMSPADLADAGPPATPAMKAGRQMKAKAAGAGYETR